MRVTTGMVQRSVLADLNKVSERLTRTQTKLASNREITRPSDDPFNASRALALRQSLEEARQHQRNVEDAQGWQDATEQALAQITETVQRARELVVTAANGALNGQARESIAAEVDQLVDSIKQNANSTYRGAYLLSGTDSDRAPFAMGAGDAYAGNGERVTRIIGPGVQMDLNVTGSEALASEPAPGGVLATLRRLSADLRADDVAAIRTTGLRDVDAGIDHLLELRAGNGARTNRLEAAASRLAQVEESMLTQLSETEDADIAKTLIELSSQQAAYQAALRAGGSIVQASLLDFLR